MNFDKPVIFPKLETAREPELPRAIVEQIENAPIDPFKKMEVLLIKLGRKPATGIELWSQGWEKNSKNKTGVDEGKLRELDEFFRGVGLVTELHEPIIDEYVTREYEGAPEIPMERERVEILVARDQDVFQGFHDAIQSLGHDAMGKFFGFPPSAIEAFGDEEKMLYRQDLPQEIRESECYPFIQFVLSKDNWQEEIKLAEQNAEAIKKASPKLFVEYTDYIKNTVEGW